MNVLIVGGTGFLGGAMTDAAVALGHRVGVLTRGRTQRALPPGVEALHADRSADLSILKARSFDLVVDTCAFTPDAVAALLDALDTRVGRYALVSTISVYSAFDAPGTTEDAPTTPATEAQRAAVAALSSDDRARAAAIAGAYGPLKRACEEEAIRKLGARALVLRAGILAGAGDASDRLTYWVRRVDEGGTFACPGEPDRPVQLIDVRDVAAWTMLAAARGVGGVFNITGPPVPMRALLETCRASANSTARVHWVSEEATLAAGLVPWTEVPLWAPRNGGVFGHIFEVSTQRAVAQGLRVRALAETVADVLAWDRGQRHRPLRAGLPPEKEARLLAQCDVPA